MPVWLAVTLGGALGASARHLVGVAVSARTDTVWATVAMNVAGSFLLGAVVASSPVNASEALVAFLGTGVAGAFTTMSAFAVQVDARWRERPGSGAAVAMVTLAAGVVAVWAGGRSVG